MRRAATPMRTPRSTAPGGADRITLEAQNLARLQAGQTPLMGGANPELHPSDFAGVTPRNTTAATPHPMATPQIGASPFPGATPGATPGGGRSVAGISATPMRTPLIGAFLLVPSHRCIAMRKWDTHAQFRDRCNSAGLISPLHRSQQMALENCCGSFWQLQRQLPASGYPLMLTYACPRRCLCREEFMCRILFAFGELMINLIST